MRKLTISGDIISNDDKWIYDWLEWDCTCPKDIMAALNDANGEDIEVTINSGGGNVISGSEIYTQLRAYKGKININIVYAASAASVIAMAGKSKITPTGLFMIHNVSSGAQGDYRAMDHQSNVLKTANKAVANAYKEKTGLSDRELQKMMDNETWLSAEDAVKKGFVDEIMFQQQEIPVLYNSTGHMFSRDKMQELKQLLNKQKQQDQQDKVPSGNPDDEPKQTAASRKEILLAKLELMKLEGQIL